MGNSFHAERAGRQWRAFQEIILWNAFKRVVSDFSAAENAKLFHDTAARVYRLDRAAGSVEARGHSVT